jgi:hypothetical protein
MNSFAGREVSQLVEREGGSVNNLLDHSISFFLFRSLKDSVTSLPGCAVTSDPNSRFSIWQNLLSNGSQGPKNHQKEAGGQWCRVGEGVRRRRGVR